MEPISPEQTSPVAPLKRPSDYIIIQDPADENICDGCE